MPQETRRNAGVPFRCYHEVVDELLIPLFPLEVVLFPGQRLPLHIFEERYKTMIGECLASGDDAARAPASPAGYPPALPAGTEFGVVLAKENAILNIGCTATVDEVTRRYDDGRLDIITLGRRRFEVLFVDEGREYLRAAAQFFQDEDAPVSDTLAEQVAALERKILEVIPQDAERAKKGGEPGGLPPGPDGALPYSFRVAGPLPLDLDFKQVLLAMRSENERLERLAQYLQQLMPRMRLAQLARAKSGGNGHCR